MPHHETQTRRLPGRTPSSTAQSAGSRRSDSADFSRPFGTVWQACLTGRKRKHRNFLSSIGWRRGRGRGGTFCEDAPLLGPLPTPASRGEEEKARSKKAAQKNNRLMNCSFRGRHCDEIDAPPMIKHLAVSHSLPI